MVGALGRPAFGANPFLSVPRATTLPPLWHVRWFYLYCCVMAFLEHAADAAVRSAEEAGREVSSLSLAEVAAAAGVSRSTLLRRAGGRAVIDAALRERIRAPVALSDRVVAAAGALIAAEGVGALTLERVAAEASCTVMSIYNQLGGRDALLVAVFAKHAVLPQFAPLLDAGATSSVEEIAVAVYRRLLDVGLDRSAVATALMIEAIARPDSPLAEHVRTDYLPRAGEVLDAFFTTLVERGAIRDGRRDALLALFLGPVQLYLEVATLDRRPRPSAERTAVAVALAKGFARAVAPTVTQEETS